MIDLIWAAGPLGLVGLVVALVLVRRNEVSAAGEADRLAGSVRNGAMSFMVGFFPAILLVLVVAAGLLWPSVALPTAAAALLGGLSTLAIAFLGVRAIAGARTFVDGKAGAALEVKAMRGIVTGPIAFGLAIASIAVLIVGTMYFVMIDRPAAFLQSELVDFGNITGGLAMGASIVALLIGVAVSVLARGLARPQAGHEKTSYSDLVAGSAGIGTDLLQSSLCAVAAAIVIASSGSIFTAQRLEAVALPILISGAGLIASGLAVAGTRATRSANPAGSLRTLGLVATAAFLVLAYLIVTALGMEGRDPYTGRTHLESAPFWAILSGALSGLVIAFITEYFTSRRPIRRFFDDGGRVDGASVLRALGLGMGSAVLPLLLIAVTVIAGSYFSGAYGVAMAAIGMLATVGITAGTAAVGPASSVAWADLPGGSTPREARSVSLGMATVGGSAAAIGRGVAVAVTGMTAMALFSAFTFATGLWVVGIDLQNPLALAGLLAGAIVPVLAAASALTGGPRVGAHHPGGQSSDSPGEAAAPFRRSFYREMLLPVIVGLFLPALLGYVLGVQAVAGLIVGATLTGLVLAFLLANAGSALVNARFYEQANSPLEAAQEGAAIARAARSLCDACPGVINTIVKLIGITAIVLVPWFVRVL